MKTCSKCHVEKPLKYFSISKRSPSGKGIRSSKCKICAYEYQRTYKPAYNKTKYETDGPFRKKHLQWDAARYLKRKYNMSQAQYDQMLKDQNDVCKICGKTSKYKLVVDHCHITNKVRGLLCQHCNKGLGHFKDDPAILDAAKQYIGSPTS